MSPHRNVLTATAAALTLVLGGALPAPAASAAPPDASYTITVDSTGRYAHPTDTPAATYIDKDGTFYFQQSAALYGSSDPRYWDFFTGTNFETATRSAAISDAVNPANSADRNNDTTWRCNNSPTGVEATSAGAGSGYAHKNYCDLVGVWVDPDTGDWYGLVHNEFTPQPFGDGLHYDSLDYAVSRNQGRVWTILGHAITSPYSTRRNDGTAFPNQTYDYGDGDPRLFADPVSGYFYVYYGSRIIPKGGVGGGNGGLAHVARAPMSAKMATGSWTKWYDGSWSQPGVGGKESNMVPVTAADPQGYTPVGGDYDPANTGTVDQQIAAGKLPPKSDLFIMNIAYDAHLGLYVGEPEVVSGRQPQRFYVTDDLSTQKWRLIGDSGGYVSGSWYRWFLDQVSKTGSTVVGRTFRSYCSIECATSSGEYATLTISSTAPAPAPANPGRTYRIGNGAGRVLAQVSGGAATTSTAAPTGSALESWTFTSNGDGSYRIANASTGGLLGVDAATAAGRAWGAKPVVTAPGAGGPTAGQQWFAVPSGSGHRLVNRYSGLALGLSAEAARPAETTPVRHWSDTSGGTVGGRRTAAEQTLTLTDTGAAGGDLSGVHTLTAAGKALDDPDHSTTPGTPLITWAPNSGANQRWILTRQSDGSYQIANDLSKLCADVSGGSTAAGAKVIQWTCTGAANQRWQVTPASAGGYRIASQKSGLSLTTASTADGSPVTQQADTGSALQRWTVG
ncbi:RICIN domain-containing protein [Nonomuraea sp. NPDC049607]|uniref:RICIN domain-containing protein n=1 Tax=Nonomuraea sp. NPDC049607 TaxID=3154732 RepID=UPI00343E4D3F